MKIQTALMLGLLFFVVLVAGFGLLVQAVSWVRNRYRGT